MWRQAKYHQRYRVSVMQDAKHSVVLHKCIRREALWWMQTPYSFALLRFALFYFSSFITVTNSECNRTSHLLNLKPFVLNCWSFSCVVKREEVKFIYSLRVIWLVVSSNEWSYLLPVRGREGGTNFYGVDKRDLMFYRVPASKETVTPAIIWLIFVVNRNTRVLNKHCSDNEQWITSPTKTHNKSINQN